MELIDILEPDWFGIVYKVKEVLKENESNE